MEFDGLKQLFSDSPKVLRLEEGTYWFVLIDPNTSEELQRLSTFINSNKINCEINGLLLEDSEEFKNLASQHRNELKFYLLDTRNQESLQITSAPWFICVKDQKILYSSQDFPISFYSKANPVLSTNNNPDTEPKVLQSKQNLDQPKFANLTKKDSGKKLEKALVKVKKLETKIKNNEQTIGIFKEEMQKLKSLVETEAEKKSDEEEPLTTYSKKLRNLTWDIVERNWNVSLADNEFWKIDERSDWDSGHDLDKNNVIDNLWLANVIKSSRGRYSVSKQNNEIKSSKEKYSVTKPNSIIKSSKEKYSVTKPTILPPLRSVEKKYNGITQQKGYSSNRNSQIRIRKFYTKPENKRK